METPGTQYSFLAVHSPSTAGICSIFLPDLTLIIIPPPTIFSVNESAIETLSDTDLEVQKSSEHSPLVMFEINLTV